MKCDALRAHQISLDHYVQCTYTMSTFTVVLFRAVTKFRNSRCMQVITRSSEIRGQRPRCEGPKGPEHLGGSGDMSPRNFLNMKPLKMHFTAF